MGWRGERVEWRACVVCSSSEKQVERLYMILSFRPSAGSWLGVLAFRRPCHHASQCGFIGAASCSSVTADLLGPGSYSAVAVASQSATYQLSVGSSVLG